MMNLSPAGAEFIKEHEGLRLKSYKCAAGKWTVGYGHTATARPRMVISEEQADALFDQDVTRFVETLNKLVKVELTQHEFDSLVSLIFNIGEAHFRTSTLLKQLNKGEKQAAATQLLRWKFAGGKPVPVIHSGRTLGQRWGLELAVEPAGDVSVLSADWERGVNGYDSRIIRYRQIVYLPADPIAALNE